MAKLKIEVNGFRMSAEGTEQLVSREREAFCNLLARYGYGAALVPCKTVPPEDDVNTPDVGVEDNADASGVGIGDESSASCKFSGMVSAPCTWKEVAERIKSGELRFEVGNCISFKMKDGQEVDAVVTQITDEFVRFESRDCVGECIQWRADGYTIGGMPDSGVREYLFGKLYDCLPDDLATVIGTTVRKYLDKDGNERKFEALLFLPSASEVFSEDDCYGDKGLYEQLDYYKDRRHRIKRETKGEDMCG